MARPRLQLDEHQILTAYTSGQTLQAIADTHQVDRCVITRIVKDAGIYVDRRGAHWAAKRQEATSS